MDYRRLHTIGRGISDAVQAGVIYPSVADTRRTRLLIDDPQRITPHKPPGRMRRPVPSPKPGVSTLPPLESAK